MVCPILEYASSVWAPHTNVNIQRLEAVLRHAAILQCDQHARVIRASKPEGT